MTSVTHKEDLIVRLNKFLAKDLLGVDQHLGAMLTSDTRLVREVGDYLKTGQGKRLRPILTILAARMMGYTGKDHVKMGAALELLHTATLLHDDVIDCAPLRRGVPTVNAKWGDDVAILIADYLYAEAFNLAHDALSSDVVRLLCKVTAQMAEGELFQIEKRDVFLTREDYLRIVRSKTAYLFSACTTLGGLLARADEEETRLLAGYGMNFGIAFQITDDTLDMAASAVDTGKQHGADIRNGKQTLPLILALSAASDADRAELTAVWKSGRDPELIMGMIRKYHGIENALEEARTFATSAAAQLETLPGGTTRDFLQEISEYVINRTT
ncbi:polyprenyl synthetase family protein [candidate division BRC1 bacterium HGW-BRC1-1]|jgi:octaprenyl-diphosphate synthase|nr:MAG: polyprenyl synthetase family protein [candidate division BRC1 bacterium HGW-BRC1-1]